LSNFQVSENTQASVPILHQLEHFLAATDKLGQNNGQNDVTLVHDQEFTHLCHSFATMSGFRHTLLQLVNTYIYSQDILKGINDQHGEHSFNNMLTVFLGCVSPRSFNSTTTSQSGETEKIIARLCSRTAFEIEGWKRIIPVRKIFELLKWNIDDYELKCEKVHHPFQVNTVVDLKTDASVKAGLSHATLIYKTDDKYYYCKIQIPMNPKSKFPKVARLAILKMDFS